MDTVAAWDNEYSRRKTFQCYPPETLVRLLAGDYIDGKVARLDGKSILDVGFGDGQSLAFYASKGMSVHGVEVSESACRRAAQNLGLDNVALKVGINTSLPFSDESFDYLVSWNVIHYECTMFDVKRAVLEYARVLRRGGRLILSTTAPRHYVVSDATMLDDSRVCVGDAGGFRKGQIHSCFRSEEDVGHMFRVAFSSVQIGRVSDDLFGKVLDWWLTTGVKP